ncbi:MAG: hypothetical protein CL946_07325 [Ectothiorhodospiraceae bacterium]|nr:hypothetical protein [Ectothiorhodospiraceae bacterium]
MPTCNEAVEMMSKSMDMELTTVERVGLKLHAFLCIHCKKYWDQILMVRDAVRQAVEKQESEESTCSLKPLPEQRKAELKALINNSLST